MSCPCCKTGVLVASIPALHDQEPVMGCTACGVHLDAAVLELYIDRELIKELKAA
jgi:hypothetical protein